MIDICFVLMPYAAIERPSIALGLLKAALKQCGIQSAVLYPNLWFADEIGIFSYAHISNGIDPARLMGEWTFSRAAFPNFHADDAEFLDLVAADFKNPNELKQVLWNVREKAEAFIERVAQSVLELQPRIVACSSMFEQHCASLALLRRIRELAPEIITFMGGANCEGSMGLVTHREFPWVDFVVSGEGDEVVPALCRQLLKRGRDIDPSDLPYGVIGSGYSCKGLATAESPRASMQDLERVPVPDYDDYFQTLRTSPIEPFLNPGLPIETSRGCWWGQKNHCTFCGLNGGGITYRSKSPKRVVEEFSYLSQRYGLNKFQVVDNILDKAHINTVLPVFADLKEPYTIFYETKANLNRQQMQLLAASGVRAIQPGIESMHDSALKLLNKGNKAWMNVQLLKWARELGMHVAWNFLIGMPGESSEWYTEILEWLPLIVHLQPPLGATKIRYDRFSPYYEQAEDYGLKLSPSRVYSYVYPLSLEALADFAYYFEDSRDLTCGKLTPIYAFDRLGEPQKALQEFVNQWLTLFRSKQPPTLSMTDDGERIRILDTRPCAVHHEHTLEDLAYWVYKVCDSALAPPGIVKALGEKHGFDVAWNDVKPIIDKLREYKILLELNGRFLSLATRSPLPSYVEQRPGGDINLRRYYQFTRQQVLESQKAVSRIQHSRVLSWTKNP
jgi:magnesium-protoporphyrin IX monomethyl ester (oxidative) cyclase